MKKVVISLSVMVAAVFIFATVFAAQRSVNTSGRNATDYSSVTTYVNSQVDTVTITRRSGLSAASFLIQTLDSAQTATVILRRKFNNVLQAALAGDTLTAFSSWDVDAAGMMSSAITVQPLPDQYVIIVTYHSSQNGVTTPSVRYGFGGVYNN